MKPLSDCHLYTFVDTDYLRGRSPEEVAAQLCQGGSDLIQLRAKKSAPAEVQRLAAAILPITRAANVGLVINDYPAVARESGAELCHLGQEDFFDQSDSGGANPSRTSLLKCGVPFGLSSHAPAQAERAVTAGAAYLGVGPVYATATKPGAKAVTLEYVRWASLHVRLPWFAIGGINLQNLDEVLDAGATRICVVSAILSATDITGACQRFKERLVSVRAKLQTAT
jgi:thiamine-phosphate pyrophosphorylase